MASVMNIANAGDNIICSAACYGGTFNLLSVTLERYGISTTFVDPDASLEELQNYCEEHRSKFDLVIFDGPDKRTEVELIKPMLKAASVVVLVDDFSDEYDFERTVEAFKADGFKALVITNPAPLAHSMKGAIIYRNDNILGI